MAVLWGGADKKNYNITVTINNLKWLFFETVEAISPINKLD